MATIIKEVGPTEISVFDMKDGQIAIITNWTIESYIGNIVQRYGKTVVQLGEDSGQSWPNLFDKKKDFPQLKVRILPKGTQIEL